MNKYELKIKEGRGESLDFLKIIQLLLAGEIDTSTQIFTSGQADKSQALSHILEFQFLFPQPQDVAWTLLRKCDEKFIQTSPYSQKGLEWLLKEGLVSDQDFVWKKGESSWNRISLSSDFDTPMDIAMEDFMDKESMIDSVHEEANVFVYQRPEPKIF